ncbi:uncharacterized protein LOC135170675 [Diachasmimorpha longicaudata]|uniref:uncharacterized protein LOC135170675 n=1 Tax=Diachasmimorpha longicaudata TaxID=58733 RepID=UPI0030B8F4D7
MVAASSAKGSDPAVIYMDIETSGLGSRAEILQLGATCDGQIFSVYITPVGNIPGVVSRVNHLTKFGNRLQYRGRTVRSVPIRTALLQFIEWMRSLEVKCCLVAHNLSFDGPKLWTEMRRHSMNAEFEEMVHCFVDTLALIKLLAQGRFTRYSLQALADFFNIQYEAHTAVEDCEALEQVLRAMEITDETLLQNSQPFKQQINHWDHLEITRRIRAGLSPLKRTVSPGIIQRIAGAGITFQTLNEVYVNDGEDGLRRLFQHAGLRFQRASFDSIHNFFLRQPI